MKLKNAKFVKSAVKDFPEIKSVQGHLLPEIAVAGRSNVGKSSLLNHLFGVKDLVKTSSTPGKTQMINFFSVNDEVVFVDLPGYGYAKVPQEVRKQWGPMMESYLQNRAQLKLMLLLLDIRRIPNEDDMQMINWAIHNRIPLILVVTKVDKVKEGEKKSNTQKILKAFNVDNLHYVYYSIKTNIGKDQLLKKIFDYA